MRFALTSLFASCRGLYLDESGKVHFYRAAYHYSAGQDDPGGLVLSECFLNAGEFRNTNIQLRTKFVEAGNVYKFTVSNDRKQ
jgi:hypothetical protein